MDKVLSVCIPSYNMEKYLMRNIESFMQPECGDSLELIIVNDGSKDGTLALANDLKSKYPNTVVVIDKPNGHYGSCVNAAINVAKGKYLRIVDADDWVDSNSVVEYLNKLKIFDVDCVFTKRTNYYAASEKYEQIGCAHVNFDTILNLDEYTLENKMFTMHNLAFRTSMIKQSQYKQTEGVCYTDLEFIYFLLSASKTFVAFDLNLYMYYIGRDDQSIGIRSGIINKSHRIKIIERLMNDRTYCTGNKNAHKYYTRVLCMLFSGVLETLKYEPLSKEHDRVLRDALKTIKINNRLAYEAIVAFKQSRFPYIKLWYKTPLLLRIFFMLKGRVKY